MGSRLSFQYWFCKKIYFNFYSPAFLAKLNISTPLERRVFVTNVPFLTYSLCTNIIL